MFTIKLEWMAQKNGAEVIYVDPKNSSRECYKCGHTEKANRPNQETFKCQKCNHSDNADFNAAKVIYTRGLRGSALNQALA